MFLSPGLAFKFNRLWVVVPQRPAGRPDSTPADIRLFKLHEPHFLTVQWGGYTISLSGNMCCDRLYHACVPGAMILFVISLVS